MLYGHDQGKNIKQLSDDTNDLVCVKMGGTGKASHTANAVLTGNGEDAVKNVATANGALYAKAANGAPKFGTLPIAQGGTGKTTAAAALTALGGVSITKVWENASPTSAFGNQKLNVDLSGYSFAMILFKLDANGRIVPPSIVPIGQPAVNAYGNSTRFFLVHTQDITFDSVGPRASVMIPYQIYGIKGVI